MPRSSQTRQAAARALERAEHARRIVELRRQRKFWGEIAEEIGKSAHYCRDVYSEVLASIPAPQVEEHRAEQIVLIDDAINSLIGIARDQDMKRTTQRTRVEAWNSIRGWLEHQARLLGLNAPEKVQVWSMEQIELEIAREEASLAEEERRAAGADHPR